MTTPLRALLGRLVLVPLVLAAASASRAADSLSFYGLIDLAVARTQAPGAAATKGIESGKMRRNYWGFTGTEGLGGGLSVDFRVEAWMRSDTGSAGRFDGDTFWGRVCYLALRGRAGQVAFGRITAALIQQSLQFNAFDDSFGFSPSMRHYFARGTVSGDVVWDNSVRYWSPNLGGASFTAHAALGEGTGARKLGLSARYFVGPLGVAGVWQKVGTAATVDATTTWQIAGSASLGSIRLFGQRGRVDNRTSGRRDDITGLGASVLVSPAQSGRVLVQYGKLSPDVGARLSSLSIGYDHFLSKRTDVYGAWMIERETDKRNGIHYGAGIRHRF